MTLLPTYPPLKDCHYWVHLKGGRVVGPFRYGWWAREPSPDEEPGTDTHVEERIRFHHPAGKKKGSLGFDPTKIKEVKVVCKRAKKDVGVVLLPDVLDDIKKALDKLKDLPKPGTPTPPTPAPGTPNCENGEVREEYSHTEEGNWTLQKTDSEDPYKHWKKVGKKLSEKVAGKLWDTIGKYFKVGSAAHVKCYTYAHYKRTVVEVYTVERCVNGNWVKRKPRRKRLTERQKVRLHVGGIPCQDPRVFSPPKTISSLDGIGSWGWIEE